jgi:hypothetical protein
MLLIWIRLFFLLLLFYLTNLPLSAVDFGDSMSVLNTLLLLLRLLLLLLMLSFTVTKSTNLTNTKLLTPLKQLKHSHLKTVE